MDAPHSSPLKCYYWNMSNGEDFTGVVREKLRRRGVVNSIIMDGVFAAGIEHDKIDLQYKNRLRPLVQEISEGHWHERATPVILGDSEWNQVAVLNPKTDWEIKKAGILNYIRTKITAMIDASPQQIESMDTLVGEILEWDRKMRRLEN